MIKNLIKKFLIFSILLTLSMPAFSQDSNPKPYEEDEFPQTLKDIRRFEIITIGALPFVTLDTTLAYSTYRYARNDFDDAYKPDIFSPASFTQEEQKGIILTSVGICVGIGITDLVVQIIKRSSRKRIKPVNYDDISVIPISEDEDASKIPLPSSDSEKVNEIQEIEE
jgi:hypothetical protein